MTHLRMRPPAATGPMMQFVEGLAQRGYRRTSNKYGIVTRIDRADWVEVLAQHLGRSPAELYRPGGAEPEAHWKDYYRRTLSEDSMEIGSQAARLIPTSNSNECGFVDLPEVEEIPAGSTARDTEHGR